MMNPHTSVGQRPSKVPARSTFDVPVAGWLRRAVGAVLVLIGVLCLLSVLAQGNGQ